MKTFKDILKETKSEDPENEIASLKALLANPDPARVAEYKKLGKSYVDMLKGKLAELGESKELEEAILSIGDKVLVKNANKYDAFAGKFVHGNVEAINGSKVDIKRMGDLSGNPPQKTYLGSVGSMTVDADDVILDTSGDSSLKLRALLGEDLAEALQVGAAVNVKDNAEVLDKKYIGKAGRVTNVDGSDVYVKFPDGRTLILSADELAVTVEEESRTYFLKAKLNRLDGSIGFWNSLEELVTDLKDDGYDISAELRDDRIEITGDADAIADVEAFMARKDGGLKSNKDAYIKEEADAFGTAVARVEDIAAWIEANTDVELGPSARDAINKYAQGLSDRLMAAH